MSINGKWPPVNDGSYFRHEYDQYIVSYSLSTGTNQHGLEYTAGDPYHPLPCPTDARGMRRVKYPYGTKVVKILLQELTINIYGVDAQVVYSLADERR